MRKSNYTAATAQQCTGVSCNGKVQTLDPHVKSKPVATSANS